MNSFQNVTITGDGVVIGNNNNVVTSINKGLSSGVLKELGESFALLRGEVIQSEKIVQKVRNRQQMQ
jgi:hypothetical protein